MTRRNNKTDRQKRALQAVTIELFEIGKLQGLGTRQVRALHHALVELDWIPLAVDPLKQLAQPLTPEEEARYNHDDNVSPRPRGGEESDPDAPSVHSGRGSEA